MHLSWPAIAIGFLVALAGCGFMAAPWWVIAAGAFGFTSRRVLHLRDVTGHLPATWVIGVSLVSDALWCGAAYAAGKALAVAMA